MAGEQADIQLYRVFGRKCRNTLHACGLTPHSLRNFHADSRSVCHDYLEGEVKGKLANAVGSQYPSHYLGTWCIQYYYRWCRTPRVPVVDWTAAPADLNGLVRFAERQNLVSVRVPSHFNWPLAASISIHLGNSRENSLQKIEYKQDVKENMWT
jgi:hypothetical protein